MKKRNLFIILALVCLLVFSVAVSAQGADVKGGLQKVKDTWVAFIDVLGPDLETPEGQNQILKFLVWIVLAVLLFEVLRRFMSQGIAAIVSAAVSIGTVLLIPREVLIGLFSAYGAFFTIILLAPIFLVLGYGTWLGWKANSAVWNSIIIFGWLIVLVILTGILSIFDRSGWIIAIVWCATAVAIAGTIIHWLRQGSYVSAGRSGMKALKDLKNWTQAQISRQMAVEIGELDKHITAIAAQGSAVTWAAPAQYDSNFGKPVEAELIKIASILKAEKLKAGYDAATMDPLVNEAIGAIEGGGTPHISTKVLPMDFLTWLPDGNLLSLAGPWPAPPPASGDPDLRTHLTKTNGVVPCLKELVKVLKAINRELAKK